MKDFENWLKNIQKEYPLYQDKDGYNIGNVPALVAGWKAALEWVLSRRKENIFTEIEKELEE